MKKINLVLLPIFLLLACANSSVKETNTNSKINITYSSTDKNDTAYVKEFSEFNKKNIGKIDSVDYYSKIKVQKFSSDNFDELISKNKYTCFIFWAPWCKGCKWMLDSAFRSVIEEHRENTTFAIISISNELKEHQKELFKLKYFIQTYILDRDMYNSENENDDWKVFENYLKDQFPEKTFKIRVPFTILLDKNKNLIFKDTDYYDVNEFLSKN